MSPTDADPDGRSARTLEGVGHLRAAALEAIAAARAFLDVVEDVIEDPSVGDEVLSNVADLAESMGARLRNTRPTKGSSSDDGDDGPGRVQRIPMG
jgi:hypothetical protein